jgi:hypothetical protein
MKLRKDDGPDAAAQLLIKNAQRHLGYTVDLGGRNMFGEKVGYNAQPWAGAFVDVCLRDTGLRLPSFTYTPAALAEFIRQGNFSREAKPGSIAVFNFSSNVGHTADAFGMPHCGIVTDVREFSSTGKFITIEGNTTGSSTHQQKDGVYQKVRSINDVLIFCHPETGRRTFNERLMAWMDRGRTKFDGSDIESVNAAAAEPTVLKINKEIRPGDRNRKIEVIQLALATVTDIRGAEPGRWDSITSTACARYQRVIGYVGKDANGLPDVNTLKRLARDTGLFTLDA